MTERSSFGGQILAIVTRNLLRVAEGEGLNPEELLECAGLSRADISAADTLLPIERHVALGTAIAARLGPVNGGLHSGAAIYGDPRGALGFAIRRSGTHRRALERFCQFIAVTNSSLRLWSESDAEGCSLHVDMVPELAALGHPTEALFSAWVSIARFATGKRWTPLQVQFRHGARGPTSEHGEFFSCPVQFDAPRSRLVIAPQALDLRIAACEHPLDALLDGSTLLAAAPESTAPQGAAAALIADLRGGRLEHRATHPPALVGRLASILLSAPASLPAFEVAFLLGFDRLSELADVGAQIPERT